MQIFNGELREDWLVDDFVAGQKDFSLVNRVRLLVAFGQRHAFVQKQPLISCCVAIPVWNTGKPASQRITRTMVQYPYRAELVLFQRAYQLAHPVEPVASCHRIINPQHPRKKSSALSSWAAMERRLAMIETRPAGAFFVIPAMYGRCQIISPIPGSG